LAEVTADDWMQYYLVQLKAEVEENRKAAYQLLKQEWIKYIEHD